MCETEIFCHGLEGNATECGKGSNRTYHEYKRQNRVILPSKKSKISLMSCFS